MSYTVGIVVGSLRKGSYSRMLANAARGLAPPEWKFVDLAIGELPLYNQDLETDSPPAAWTTFRSQAASTNGILFITPEYNRGMPGSLKNALDVGSRPWGKSIWNGKPTAVMSITPGPLGAMAAHQQLRHTLSILNSPTMPGPEIYMPGAVALFGDDGTLKNEDTKKLVTSFLQHFQVWMGRFSP